MSDMLAVIEEHKEPLKREIDQLRRELASCRECLNLTGTEAERELREEVALHKGTIAQLGSRADAAERDRDEALGMLQEAEADVWRLIAQLERNNRLWAKVQATQAPPAPDAAALAGRLAAVMCWRKGDPSTDDTRWIGERYAELKRTVSFDEAERRAKAEWAARVLAEASFGAARPAAIDPDAASELRRIVANAKRDDLERAIAFKETRVDIECARKRRDAWQAASDLLDRLLAMTVGRPAATGGEGGGHG